MKDSLSGKFFIQLIFIFATLFTACNPSGNKNSPTMKNTFAKGTYGYDLDFFTRHNIKTVELKDSATGASVMIVPEFQGRVMTSSTNGREGQSFGWINYSFIESAEKNDQFNPFGGEERIWLGPEGGPFSVYFKKDAEQIFANWIVPKEIDTEGFDLTNQTSESVSFRKDFPLENASGNRLDIGIERNVKILGLAEAENAMNMKMHDSLTFVAYESENILINKGNTSWNAETGILSIWMLSMFNPSEEGVVFIPFKTGDEKESGKIVTDDYFGKVPSDRLIISDGIIFFKTDGKFRSKIGISPQRALPWCGSYDPANRVLTLLWYSAPEKPLEYVNSKWGATDNLLSGDVVNSYNDGPVEDGSIMGPFYEIESSSPAAMLNAGEKITHTQRIFHISGDENKLSLITENLFGLTITEIKQSFK